MTTSGFDTSLLCSTCAIYKSTRSIAGEQSHATHLATVQVTPPIPCALSPPPPPLITPHLSVPSPLHAQSLTPLCFPGTVSPIAPLCPPRSIHTQSHHCLNPCPLRICHLSLSIFILCPPSLPPTPKSPHPLLPTPPMCIPPSPKFHHTPLSLPPLRSCHPQSHLHSVPLLNPMLPSVHLLNTFMAMIHTKIMDNFLANHSIIIQFAGCKGTVHTKLYDNSICGLTLFGYRS